VCADLGRYGMAIGIAFQHADDRDDGEFVEHTDTAAHRMRTLAAEARSIASSLPQSSRLLAFAEWFASRA